MSKPETPCLPECRYSEGLDGVIKTCAPGCPNAPKAEAPRMTTLGEALAEACPLPQAEAPPAPVSEPPIDPRSREAADALIAKLKAENAALEAERNRLLIEAARADVENAILTAELSDLKHGIPLTYNPNAMCRSGHEMVLFKNGDGQSPLLRCPMCDITAEVERLKENVGVKYGATGMCQDRHPMVMFPRAGGWGENCPMCAIRAKDAKELERLRDLIVAPYSTECDIWSSATQALRAEGLAILAAREAGKQ